MKAIAACGVLCVVMGSVSLAKGAPDAPVSKQFKVKFVLTGMKDGHRIVLTEPALLTRDGEEGTVLAGDQVSIDTDTKDVLTYGLEGRIKVREVVAGKLRVSMYVAHSELDAHAASSVLIREQGVHCVRTIKPSEKIELDLGADLRVAVTVDPVVADARIGKQVDLQFTALDGRAIDLKDYRGKVVLLNFWATWCPPCVAGLPDLERTAAKLHDKGFAVIGMSYDTERDRLEAFLANRGLKWPQFFDVQGPDAPLMQSLGSPGLPTYWLIDGQGLLADVNAGEDLESKVKRLLAGAKEDAETAKPE